MTTFDERERAFESKFELDEAFEFRIQSRMAHLFGLWAALQLSLSGDAAAAYAEAAVDFGVTKDGRAKLIKKTLEEFLGKGLSVGHHRLEREMEDCYVKARTQLSNPN